MIEQNIIPIVKHPGRDYINLLINLFFTFDTTATIFLNNTIDHAIQNNIFQALPKPREENKQAFEIAS